MSNADAKKMDVMMTSQEKDVLGLPSYKNWTSGLKRSSKNRVLQTIENVRYGLQTSPKLRGILRFNEFTQKTEIHGADWTRYTDSISDLDVDYIKQELEKGELTKRDAIQSAINLEASDNPYHPVRDVLNNLTWDGRDHIAELFPKYLGAEQSDYTSAATTLLFGGIINRVMTPGCKFDTMVILVDEKQGGGKSTMCKFLAISDSWFSTIRDVDDRQKVVEAQMGHIVLEMEELEGLVKARSIESVRAYLSCSTDTYRTPYDKYARDLKRQSVCIGTSNDLSCLPLDRAGNRRFIPIKCDSSKAVRHPLDNEAQTRADVMQCYAQAMVMYNSGTLQTKLSSEWEKRLPGMQTNFLPDDTTAGIIEQWIIDNPKDYYCVAMIHKEALGNYDNPKPSESRVITSILDSLKCGSGNKFLSRYEKSDGIRRFPVYGRQRAWRMTNPAIIDRWVKQHPCTEYCVPMIYHEALGKSRNISPTTDEVEEISTILDGLKDDEGNIRLMRNGVKPFIGYEQQESWCSLPLRTASEQFHQLDAYDYKTPKQSSFI